MPLGKHLLVRSSFVPPIQLETFVASVPEHTIETGAISFYFVFVTWFERTGLPAAET